MIRVEKGARQPADAFWSLTMRDTDLFFVPSAFDRYELGPRNTVATNRGGSIEPHLNDAAAIRPLFAPEQPKGSASPGRGSACPTFVPRKTDDDRCGEDKSSGRANQMRHCR